MADLEVPQPIITSSYEEPVEHWFIQAGVPAERRLGIEYR